MLQTASRTNSQSSINRRNTSLKAKAINENPHKTLEGKDTIVPHKSVPSFITLDC